MNKKQITELFYKDKNYSKVKELLINSSDSRSFNVLAKIALQESNIELAFDFFDKAYNTAGCAYCEFLSGNIKEAEILLNIIKGSSSFADWLLFFAGLAENNLRLTTYFQVRNFYEQDLEMLIKYNQCGRASVIIGYTDYISGFNREVYKYCARVMMNNGNIKEAESMLRKSLDIYFGDPETHYLMGEVNMIKGNKQEAVHQFETSSKVNGGYYPADKQLSLLKNYDNFMHKLDYKPIV